MPIVRKPTYLYTKFRVVDDMMSLLCGRPISWVSEPRINSCEFAKLNSLYLRITCHNIYPIPHVHTVPIERYAFLYAFITIGSMCFPSCLSKPLLISLGVRVRVRNCSSPCLFLGF